MVFKKQCTLVALMAVFAVGKAAAETLDDAWQIALGSNHQIKAVHEDTSASEQLVKSAEGQRLPQLSVSSAYTQLSHAPAAQTSIGGATAKFTTSQAGSAKAQAIASVPIFTSGRITHNINAAKATLEATEANETTTVLGIKLQVAEAYVAVLRQESAVRVAQSHVDSLAAHSKDVKNLFEQGVVARNDDLAADVELANAKQTLVQVNNRLDIARASYNQLLGRKLDEPVKLAPLKTDPPKETLDELSNSALKQRPELDALNKQMESLAHQAKSVKAGLLPQVSLNGGFQYQENRFQVYQGLWNANVGVDWKLFDGSSSHQSDALIRQAAAVQEQYDDLASQIALQVRQAWLDAQETQQRITVSAQAIDGAEENMKVTADRYSQGLSTNTDVLKAEELRTTAQDNFNNATHDAKLAMMRLRRAVGIL